MLTGVPAHVDGRMLGDHRGGGRRSIINPDRMWHYTEGIAELGPDLAAATASGSCPARRRCGSTRTGKRLPVPLFPGFDTLGTLEHITQTGYDYTWFVLTQKIIEKEFALSGSEQNPDLTGKTSPAARPARAARAPPARSRRSRTTAPTSSSRDNLRDAGRAA